MITRFIHTADWQLGKPFAGIEDSHKRALVVQERLNVIARIGAAAREHRAEFIVVAGDLFDSSSATKATVSAMCSAVGKLELPVLVIPGNHDHAGPGSVWEQPFFQRESSSLEPNLRVLLGRTPVELSSAIILPCPLLRRADAGDPTQWLRAAEATADLPHDKPRIVLAHGSTQDFGEARDEEESSSSTANLIDLERLDTAAFDYIALGDWHGTKQVGAKAWYSGTPEFDRFPKSAAHQPGQILAVTATRGAAPEVQPIRTARFGWHELAFDFSDDAALARLQEQLAAQLGGRASEDLLKLELTGTLGIQAATELEQFLESLRARLLRLKLTDRTTVAPTEEETLALTRRACDPLISRVAAQLVERSTGADDVAAIARVALRELHTACTRS